MKQLRHHAVGCVLDVGANDGGYARELREFGYGGRIVSFEPTTTAYAAARASAESDSSWAVLPYALGAKNDQVTINVAGNSAASSSMLPMLAVHREAAPESAFVTSEVVEQRRLDDVWGEVVPPGVAVFVKLDVQGYERHILDGAGNVLQRDEMVGLQIELSLQPLYDGAWLYDDALRWVRDRGFDLTQLIPGFSHPMTGEMLQCDGVFFRSR